MKSVTTPPWATWGKGTWVQVVTTRVGWGGVICTVSCQEKKNGVTKKNLCLLGMGG